MAEVKNINALSMESIDLDEVYQQPEQGKILMNDDIVICYGWTSTKHSFSLGGKDLSDG